LGLAGRLFDHDFKTVGHLITECWIKNVWKETLAYSLRIIEQTASLKPECEGDKMLMEAFMQNGYKGKELRELNKCRVYLQCTNLPNFITHHHITILDLAKMTLGKQDQAIRLSNALGKPPLGIAVGKP
jgi:hypothetical protein